MSQPSLYLRGLTDMTVPLQNSCFLCRKAGVWVREGTYSKRENMPGCAFSVSLKTSAAQISVPEVPVGWGTLP